MARTNTIAKTAPVVVAFKSTLAAEKWALKSPAGGSWFSRFRLGLLHLFYRAVKSPLVSPVGAHTAQGTREVEEGDGGEEKQWRAKKKRKCRLWWEVVERQARQLGRWSQFAV
jgi:hypothetical protein